MPPSSRQSKRSTLSQRKARAVSTGESQHKARAVSTGESQRKARGASPGESQRKTRAASPGGCTICTATSIRRTRSVTLHIRSASITLPVGRCRYELRPRRRQVLVLASEEDNEPLLQQLALTTLELQTKRHDIGCTIVHALDQVQDVVSLSKQREELLSRITDMNEGFHEGCRTRYIEILENLTSARGRQTNGTSKNGSIPSYSLDDLTTLGIDFSTRPTALELDRLVSGLWHAQRASCARITCVIQRFVREQTVCSCTGIPFALVFQTLQVLEISKRILSAFTLGPSVFAAMSQPWSSSRLTSHFAALASFLHWLCFLHPDDGFDAPHAASTRRTRATVDGDTG
ncbi:hypothetical protein NMY22_g8352 [Coprinellus aureogranulatus]|nr:hypothetical protein NMY22_g8352 [Coprinellus aureogranulatus]